MYLKSNGLLVNDHPLMTELVRKWNWFSKRIICININNIHYVTGVLFLLIIKGQDTKLLESHQGSVGCRGEEERPGAQDRQGELGSHCQALVVEPRDQARSASRSSEIGLLQIGDARRSHNEQTNQVRRLANILI